MTERWAISTKGQFDVAGPYSEGTFETAYPPTLLTPVDEAEVVPSEFTWDFTPLDGVETQARFAFKREQDATWDVVSGTPSLANIGNGVGVLGDSFIAAAHNTTPFLTIIDVSDWSTVSGTPTLPSTGMQAVFSPNGAFLAVGHWGTPYLTIVDTSDWSVVPGTPVLPNVVRGMDFSPNGSFLALTHRDGDYLTVIDTSDWSVVTGTPVLAGEGYGAKFSHDGSLLGCAHDLQPCFTLIDTTDWSIVTGIPNDLEGYAMGVAFSPGDSLLAVSGLFTNLVTDRYVKVYDTSDWSLLAQLNSSVTREVKFSLDGLLILTVEGDSPFLRVRNVGSWTQVPGTPALPGTGTDIEFSESGSFLAATHVTSPFLTIIDTASLRQWWNGSAWVEEEVFIESTNESVTFPSGVWE